MQDATFDCRLKPEMRSLQISPMIRPMFIIALASVGLVTISGWGPVPFVNFVIVLLTVILLAWQIIVLTKQERVAAERRAFEATAARLNEFARLNAELNRELTESRVLEEETNLQVRAFDALLQGVIITDPLRTGNPIVYVNERFTALTGYNRKEIIGKSADFLYGKETSPRTLATIRNAIRKSQPCFVEQLTYRKDGSTFWTSVSIAPIVEAGRLTNFVTVLTDITASKQVEEQLRHSQKMEAVGHLAGGIAHDFNNLLTVINGCAEMLRASDDVNENGIVLVDEIFKAGERAANLTRQLLAYSRKTVLQPKMICINDMVRNMVRLLERLIGEDIQLTTKLADGINKVRVDMGQMEQVLVNLVVNARDAMPQGGSISVETSEVSLDERQTASLGKLKPGQFIRLSVCDSGSGMDSATLQRIFEPFFTTKPVGKGTGLGLAMVYGILEASGGHITVSSKLNVGTTFQIYLPVSEEASKSHFGSSRVSLNSGSETVLVVEDEPGVRSLTCQALRCGGYNVLEATDGEHALQVSDQFDGDIHLLITDLIMPKMNGSELRNKILERYNDVRIIYMSGYTDDAIVRHGISENECDFLQKPFTLSALLRKTREVLDREINDPSAEHQAITMA